MKIRPIHTDAEYQAALKEISPLFDNEPEPGTPEAAIRVAGEVAGKITASAANVLAYSSASQLPPSLRRDQEVGTLQTLWEGSAL